MTRVNKDYARKNYSDMGYKDWTRNKTSKQVWNNVLESYPGTGEFSRVLNTTPLSRSIQRFIAQSEFKKPYNDVDFVDMEGDWEGPGNGLSFTPGVDQPFNFGYKPPIDPNDIPWDVIFLAQLPAPWNVYCSGADRKILIYATEPIISVTLSLGEIGLTQILGMQGLGTRSIYMSLYADFDQIPMSLQFDVEMRAENPNVPGQFQYHNQFIPFHSGKPEIGGEPGVTEGEDQWTGCCQGHEEWYNPEPIGEQIWHIITRMGNLSEANNQAQRTGVQFFRWDDARDTSPCTHADPWVNGYTYARGFEAYEPGTPLGQGPAEDYPNPRWPVDSRFPDRWTLYTYSFYFFQMIIDQDYPLYQGVIEVHMDMDGASSFYSTRAGSERSFGLYDTTLNDVAGEFGNLTTSNFLDRTSIEMAPVVYDDPDPSTDYTFVFELNAAAIAKINAANYYYGGTGYVSFCMRDYKYDISNWGGDEFGPQYDSAPWFNEAYAMQTSLPYGFGLFSTCYPEIDDIPW